MAVRCPTKNRGSASTRAARTLRQTKARRAPQRAIERQSPCAQAIRRVSQSQALDKFRHRSGFTIAAHNGQGSSASQAANALEYFPVDSITTRVSQTSVSPGNIYSSRAANFFAPARVRGKRFTGNSRTGTPVCRSGTDSTAASKKGLDTSMPTQ